MSVIFIFLIEASGDVFNVIGVVFAVLSLQWSAWGCSWGVRCVHGPSITLKELCFDPARSNLLQFRVYPTLQHL